MPPEATAVILPLLPPEQPIGVTLQLSTKAAGDVTMEVQVVEQPFAPVTVTVYVAAIKLLVAALVAPVFHK